MSDRPKLKMSLAAREVFERQQREARERKALDPYTLVETQMHHEWEETGHGFYAVFSQDLTDEEIDEMVGMILAIARRQQKPTN